MNFSQIIQMSLKEKIHALIDSCDDEMLLQDTFSLLESASQKKDWWSLLSTEQQAITARSIAQLKNNETQSHQQVQQKIWQKL